jgi:hypothetical protein
MHNEQGKASLVFHELAYERGLSARTLDSCVRLCD